MQRMVGTFMVAERGSPKLASILLLLAGCNFCNSDLDFGFCPLVVCKHQQQCLRLPTCNLLIRRAADSLLALVHVRS